MADSCYECGRAYCQDRAPCAERIARTTCREPRQVGLAVNHFWRRMPIRPFDHVSNALRTGPCETLAADANTTAQNPALAKNQVKVCVGRIDDDGAGRFGRGFHCPPRTLRSC